MDRQQVKDLMEARGYSLYATIEDEVRPKLVFLKTDHPIIAAHVTLYSERHIVTSLRALVGMLKIETLDFGITHPKFHETYEAQMERALRDMGVWE